MAYATHSRHATPSAPLWRWLGDVRGTLAEHLAQHRLYRTTRNELEALSDRDLADLGLHRADIRGIALDAARGIASTARGR